MSVKYNKARDRFEVRHYEDLSNEEIVKGVNNIADCDSRLESFKKKLKKINFEKRKLEAEIEDLENYQDVIGRVTHIYNGVPVMISSTLPDEENSNGRFTFSGTGGYNKRKILSAWTNAHLKEEERLNDKYIWCFRLQDGDNHEETFLSKQYKKAPSEKGFSMEFVKTIAYEFVVNDRPISDFYRNLDKWFEKVKRDVALKDLLES